MSNISHNPHDKLVTKLLEDKKIAADLFKNHLDGQVAKKLDLATLELTSQTAVTQSWKKLHNDLAFRCKTKEGKDTYIYCLIEHQSEPQRLLPLRFLRYKMTLLDKYIDSKKPPKTVPNIIGIIIYGGKSKYPYPKDVASCFDDPKLALKEITEPMIVVEPSAMPENTLQQQGGADAVLKLLIKYSKQKDFVGKMESLMKNNSKIFLSLSVTQASKVLEYVLFVGKGTETNAKRMKATINQVYGTAKGTKIFSLVDYFKQEGRLEGVQKGIEQGLQQGREEGSVSTLELLKSKGWLTEEHAQKAAQELKADSPIAENI